VSLHLFLTDAESKPSASSKGRAIWQRKTAHVWVSGALARPFIFGPVTGLKGWREAHQAAAAAAPAACGLAGPCTVVLEADPSAGPVLATAMDVQALRGIESAAHARGLRMASIRPAWTLATELRGLGATGNVMLGCREHGALTVLCWRDGAWMFAATSAPVPTADQQQQLMGRLHVSLGLNADDIMQAALDVESTCSPQPVRWLGPQMGASA
jgi:hypothetical protein